MDKDSYARAFGENLKTLRKRRGLSQEQLAEAIDKTVDTVSGIERGISYPRVETALDIAGVLGIPIYELFIAGAGSVGGDARRREVIIEINRMLNEQDVDVLEIIMGQIQHVLKLKNTLSQ